MPTITNAKSIQKKSKLHCITQTGPATFTVVSGASGNEYHVTLTPHGGSCSCQWSQYRPLGDSRSGCSHVVACYNHLAQTSNRAVSAWSNREDAQRQHRPAVAIGDGVTLTLRKAA